MYFLYFSLKDIDIKKEILQRHGRKFSGIFACETRIFKKFPHYLNRQQPSRIGILFKKKIKVSP